MTWLMMFREITAVYYENRAKPHKYRVIQKEVYTFKSLIYKKKY
jgi:hypothetical protein